MNNCSNDPIVCVVEIRQLNSLNWWPKIWNNKNTEARFTLIVSVLNDSPEIGLFNHKENSNSLQDRVERITD